MSWLFSQALVAEYSAGSCLDGEPSAQLNVMPTPHKFWRNDKTMEFCDLSQFGLTLQLLTADHGEALLTSYLAAFRARTSAPPEKALASPAQDQVCGKKWHGLLARYNPDTSSWKTAQCSLLEDLEQSLETWPRWGSMRNGECFLQPMLVPTTKGKGYGSSVPTPTVYDATGKGTPRLASNLEDGGRHGVSLHHFVAMWPTPTTCGNYNRPGASKTSGLGLATAVKMYPTACARDFRTPGKSRMERTGQKNGDNLPQVIGGALNPTWVEWLMGWPLGWTDLKPLAMDKFQQWQQQHSSYLGQGFSEEAA